MSNSPKMGHLPIPGFWSLFQLFQPNPSAQFSSDVSCFLHWNNKFQGSNFLASPGAASNMSHSDAIRRFHILKLVNQNPASRTPKSHVLSSFNISIPMTLASNGCCIILTPKMDTNSPTTTQQHAGLKVRVFLQHLTQLLFPREVARGNVDKAGCTGCGIRMIRRRVCLKMLGAWKSPKFHRLSMFTLW